MDIVSVFINLKLRVKLLFAFGSILILTVLLFLKFFQTLNKVDSYQRVSEKVDAVNIHLLEMDAAAQYFIFEGYKRPDFHEHDKSQFVEVYAQNLLLVREELQFIESANLLNTVSTTEVILQSLDSLDTKFNLLITLLKKRGFKDFGLEGLLRKAIHSVENSSFPYDKADMLTLRRHEKDFFLRKDIKYQNEFDAKFDRFVSYIQTTPSNAERDAILADLRDYQMLFSYVVDIDRRIGLKETDGFKGQINADLIKLKGSIQSLRLHIKDISSFFKQSAITTLIMLFVAQLTLGVILTIVYSDVITKAIKELRNAMKSLSDGIFPTKLIVKSNEEIGETKLAFNQLLDRMKAAQNFSEELGNGKLKAAYDLNFKDDILARSLIKMQIQLVDASEKQEIINWNNLGLAKLNEILKTENSEIHVLGDKIINLLVKYLNANQGAIYVIHQSESEHYAERIATYAYNKKKFIDQRIEVGQGLIGQCMLEKSTIVLTDIPSEFIKITSGLGEAVPSFIIILPLIIQNRIEGIVELASFQKLKSHQIGFLERIAENIASILANKKINSETAHLLDDARHRAQQLASQEEEIRQNAEEMQAIQEQLEREKMSMEGEITLLKSMLQNQLSNA